MPRNKKYVYICSPKRKVFPCGMYWRDAGVVDRAALEMRCTGNCTGGSNPSLSANDRKVGWVANIRLQPFLFSGRDEFIRSGLKMKVGRMVRRRKSGVRKVASGPTEGRTGGMR